MKARCEPFQHQGFEAKWRAAEPAELVAHEGAIETGSGARRFENARRGSFRDEGAFETTCRRSHAKRLAEAADQHELERDATEHGLRHAALGVAGDLRIARHPDGVAGTDALELGPRLPEAELDEPIADIAYGEDRTAR